MISGVRFYGLFGFLGGTAVKKGFGRIIFNGKRRVQALMRPKLSD
jgi:hypothetical protein